jgi:transcriptional regulator with XRE-family HTH domain
MTMIDTASSNLARNLRDLREARRLSQAQLSKLAGIPRPTVANLESGSANPTLSVMLRLANSLQVLIEELIAPPRSTGRLYTAEDLPTRRRGRVTVRKLLPDPMPGLETERMEIPGGAHLVGVPHTRGTREYLTCETGTVVVTTPGGRWTLEAGDVLVFRGDQRHSYHNPETDLAVAYSIVSLTPVAA